MSIVACRTSILNIMQGIHRIDKNGFLSLGGLLFGLTLALLSAGCNHSLSTPREGDYTGTFTATYHVVTPDVNIDTVITGPVTLNLSNDQFENSGNPNRFPPARCAVWAPPWSG